MLLPDERSPCWLLRLWRSSSEPGNQPGWNCRSGRKPWNAMAKTLPGGSHALHRIAGSAQDSRRKLRTRVNHAQPVCERFRLTGVVNRCLPGLAKHTRTWGRDRPDPTSELSSTPTRLVRVTSAAGKVRAVSAISSVEGVDDRCGSLPYERPFGHGAIQERSQLPMSRPEKPAAPGPMQSFPRSAPFPQHQQP